MKTFLRQKFMLPLLCWVVVISVGLIIYQQNELIRQQQAVVIQQQEDMAFVKDHLEGIYMAARAENSRTYTIMDTIIRIFHYAKPHEGPTWNCPECEDIRKQSKEEEE